MTNEQQSLGSVKRSVVVGLGQKSLPTLYKLRQRLSIQFGAVPVVGTICVAPQGTALDQQDLGGNSATIQMLALEDILSEDPQAFAESVDQVMLSVHVDDLLTRGVIVDNTLPLEVIFVGSLAEEITASSLVEVAKVAYPRVLRVGNRNDVVPSMALLSLPNTGREPEIVLRAAKGLKLISEQLETGQKRITAQTEFALQQVYLLEHTNRASLTVSEDNVLSWMMGDWLFFYLTRGVPSVENPAPNGGEYYSSFGYASLFVPELQMRQVLTEWFVREAYNDFLLALPSITRKPEDPDDYVPRSVEIDTYFEGLTTTDLNSERIEVGLLANELQKAEVNPSIKPAAFANVIPFQYKELEQGLARAYDRAIQDTSEATSDLTKRQSEQDEKSRQKVEPDVVRALDNLWKLYLDSPDRDRVNYAPLETALSFFERTAKRFEQAAEEYRKKVNSADDKIKAARQRILKTRAGYWEAAQFLSPPTERIPFPYIFPAITFLLALSVALYIGLILIDIFQQPILAIAVVVLTFIAGIAFFFAAFWRAGQFKSELIGLYVERLKDIVEYNDARLVAGFYGRVVAQIRREYVDVLKHSIETIKNELHEGEYHKQRDPYERIRIRTREEPYPIAETTEKQLYGTPNYELERSVVERKDLDQWYEELFPSNVQPQVQAFFEQQPLSVWVRKDLYRKSLRPALEQWLVQQKLGVLKTTPIQRYLVKYADRQRSMAELMVKQAQSYLRIDQTQISGDQQMLEVIHLHVARNDKDYVEPLFVGLDKRLELTYQINEDPLRIDTISRLRWVALGVPTVIRELKIERIDRGDQLELQDEFTRSTLSVYELVALCRVVEVIVQDQGIFGYKQKDALRSRYASDNEVKYTFVDLGKTYQAVVNNLENPTYRTHRKAIHEQLVAEMQAALQADPSGETLGKRIYAFFDEQTTDKVEREALHDYLNRFGAEAAKRENVALPDPPTA